MERIEGKLDSTLAENSALRERVGIMDSKMKSVEDELQALSSKLLWLGYTCAALVIEYVWKLIVK